MRFLPEQIITSGDMSGNITSTVVNLQQDFGYSIQAVWTGSSPVGNLTLQASNDNATWTNVDVEPAGGAAGNFMWNVTGSNYNYVRLTYTFTSGTGTLNAYLFARSF